MGHDLFVRIFMRILLEIITCIMFINHIPLYSSNNLSLSVSIEYYSENGFEAIFIKCSIEQVSLDITLMRIPKMTYFLEEKKSSV